MYVTYLGSFRGLVRAAVPGVAQRDSVLQINSDGNRPGGLICRGRRKEETLIILSSVKAIDPDH
jgi:hypothetical protein